VFDDFRDCFFDVVLVVAYADDVGLDPLENSEKVNLLMAEDCSVYWFEGCYYLAALFFWHDGLSALSSLNCGVSGYDDDEPCSGPACLL